MRVTGGAREPKRRGGSVRRKKGIGRKAVKGYREEDRKENRTIAVIGGGASGMMAAVTAARLGAQVTILEAGERLGRKILSTGNGKCNLGNALLNAQQYHGAQEAFLQNCLERFGTRETLRFFRGIGLYTKEKNGYYYPLSEQASAVLDALRYEISVLGIRVCTGIRVQDLRRKPSKDAVQWQVDLGNRTETFDCVIIACGGKAMPITGSDGSGYELAKKLGHKIIPVVPALTNLKCKEPWFKSVAGVRSDAKLTLFAGDGRICACERGELQWTDYGISGIPVFQLSRTAAYLLREQKELSVAIDLLPDVSQQEWERALEERMEQLGRCKSRTAEEFCNGILHKKLMALLLKLSGIRAGQTMDGVGGREMQRLWALCRDLRVTVIGTGNFQNAQVCAGGVDTRELTRDLESKRSPGVYFAGEILDVDGRCGGYNLQWAWTSGFLAGSAAAGKD